MVRGGVPTQEAIWLTSGSMSYSLIRFQHYLPGVRVRPQGLKAQGSDIFQMLFAILGFRTSDQPAIC